MKGSILVVDDEPLKRMALQLELTEAGYEVLEATDAEQARRILDSRNVDVVVSDDRLSGMDGLELLTYVRKHHPATEVILMTAYATVDLAVRAIKRGAYDYITKPFTTAELIDRIEPALSGRNRVAAGCEMESFGEAIARSAAMKRVLAQLRAIADSAQPVLLTGATGTGKTLLAEAIHLASPRSPRAAVRVCCGDDPAVVHAELFGHDRQPGAARHRSGRLDQAHNSTLILEDIDRLTLEAQDRLLHLLEHAGSHDAQPAIDVRLICTTRQDLEAMANRGALRNALLYRLGPAIHIPPLYDRPQDVRSLAQHFLKRHAGLAGSRNVGISPAAVDELCRYTWPGNARELENFIQRALALCDGDEIRPEHILPLSRRSSAPLDPLIDGQAGGLGLNETVADIERRLILMALRQANGNQARAAQKLGIPRTTLRDKMARYNILE